MFMSSISEATRRANKALQKAKEMATANPSAIRTEDAAAFSELATRTSPDVVGLRAAADASYEAFCVARNNDADVELLRRLSARFNVIASFEEAARLRAQNGLSVAAEMIDCRLALNKQFRHLDRAFA